jgi:hypothetical protein
MDHMLELARHPDLREALALASLHDASDPPDPIAPIAEALTKKEFLADEYPAAWVIEVLHEFYAHPPLAAKVWVKLRYCKAFRRELADMQLREDAKKVKKWGHRLAVWRRAGGAPESDALAAAAQIYATDPQRAVREYATKLGAEPAVVRQLCEASNAYPDPPAFLKDLLDADETKIVDLAARDRRIRDLFSNPALVRNLAAKTHTPVPFSIVQEQELDQICQARVEIRPDDYSKSEPGSLRGTPSEASSSPSPDTMHPEALRRKQREARRSVIVGSQHAAVDEVLKRHKEGKYPRHSARVAVDMNLFGLAFSGGGIRSATFNLGVLQALSRIGLLKHVDYLSTVSGGGYIGTWLAAWIRRELDDLPAGTPKPGARVMEEMQRRLSPVRSPNPIDERVKPIRFLREYSNYLTPRTGFFSADTWTMLGIYARNALLNQVIITAVFAALLLAPRNWFPAVEYLLGQRVGVAVLRGLLWFVATAVLCMNLRKLDPRDASAIVANETVSGPAVPPRYARPWVIHRFVVLPWLLMFALLAQPMGEWAISSASGQDWYQSSLWLGLGVAATIVILLSGGRADRCWASGGTALGGFARAILAIGGSALVAGIVAAGIWQLFIKVLPSRLEVGSIELAWHLNALATPVLMGAASLAIVAMLGILGERFPDEHREWWSRLRTTMHVYAIGWLAWFVASLYVPWGYHVLVWNDYGFKWAAGALATWVGSTLFGVQKGPDAEVKEKEEGESKAPPSLSSKALRWAAFAAPYVFVVGLVLGISLAIDAIYLSYAPDTFSQALAAKPIAGYWAYAKWTTTTCHWWTGVCAVVALVFSWRVDINEFSIHHFYKNRLVRCYLGASHTKDRKPDWFTGFDPKDDVPLKRFDCEQAPTTPGQAPSPGYAGPYPIVNCALNLVGGQDLAWQERKAASFVFTPKYCGYDVDRSVLTKDPDQHSEGFVATKNFYNETSGPMLGMAMAISGAAANPNMGRASSPALGFLMTVFNVRLGWWIGNTRHKIGKARRSPGLGLAYTFVELFGLTDDRRRFVNLSDGGHFDNLGVYELIRRSCRYIVVCDAGQDEKSICEDLGDLVRRCRTDFGVEIDIAVDRIRQRDASGRSQSHCVVGKINYLNLPRRVGETLMTEDDKQPLVPGGKPAYETGYLIYIKPSLTGDEPQDVLEYARRVDQFPHESTADQWFGESQFESYRTLGMHITERTFARYQDDDTHPVGCLDDLFERLYRYWYPPAVAVNERSTEHAAEYSRLLEIVRTTANLQGLDPTLFSALTAQAIPTLNDRDRFYMCNSLIQLMENVYADLDLERNWSHPHVMGWMEVFQSWAKTKAFHDTWSASCSTYAERFRNFYDDRLAR